MSQTSLKISRGNSIRFQVLKIILFGSQGVAPCSGNGSSPPTSILWDGTPLSTVKVLVVPPLWSPLLGIYRGRHDFILSTCFFIIDFWKFNSIHSFCFVSASFSPSLQCFCWHIYPSQKLCESNVDVKSKGSTPTLCWLLLRWLISRKWLISSAKYFLILSLVFSPEHASVSVVIWIDWEFSKPLSSGSFLSNCPSISFLSHITISSKETLDCTIHTACKYQSSLLTSYIFCPTLEHSVVKLPATCNKNHLSFSFQ